MSTYVTTAAVVLQNAVTSPRHASTGVRTVKGIDDWSGVSTDRGIPARTSSGIAEGVLQKDTPTDVLADLIRGALVSDVGGGTEIALLDSGSGVSRVSDVDGLGVGREARPIDAEPLPQTPVSVDDSLKQQGEIRIKLFAKRYARGSLSVEESARLDIATERMRSLAPRVTEEDFAQLDAARRAADASMQDADEILARLGVQ